MSSTAKTSFFALFRMFRAAVATAPSEALTGGRYQELIRFYRTEGMRFAIEAMERHVDNMLRIVNNDTPGLEWKCGTGRLYVQVIRWLEANR